jgi:hypothetical protein
MRILIEYPALVAFPGLAFVALFRLVHRRLVLGAALVWLVYGLYEYGMKLRILCSGECNIRIDLLVIYPALVIVSAIGLLAAARGRRGRFGNAAP